MSSLCSLFELKSCKVHTFAIACIDAPGNWQTTLQIFALVFLRMVAGTLKTGVLLLRSAAATGISAVVKAVLGIILLWSCQCQFLCKHHATIGSCLLQHAVTGWFGQSGHMILGASQVLWYFGVWRHLETWSRGFCPKMSQDFADVIGVIGVMVLLAVLRLSHIIVEVRSKSHFTDNWHALIEFGVRFPCRFHALSKAVFFEIAVLEFSGWYWWKFLMARARTWGWNPRRIEDFEFILLSSNEEWNMWNSLAASLCFYYLSFYFGDIVLQTQFGGRPKPCRCMMNRLCFQIFQLFRIFVTKLNSENFIELLGR